MTSENILENVKEMVKAFSEKINSPEVAKWIIDKPEEWLKPSLYPEFFGNAAKIILACREDIQRKVDKTSGRSSARLANISKISMLHVSPHSPIYYNDTHAGLNTVNIFRHS